jgi:hypothetical protein
MSFSHTDTTNTLLMKYKSRKDNAAFSSFVLLKLLPPLPKAHTLILLRLARLNGQLSTLLGLEVVLPRDCPSFELMQEHT